MSRIMKAYFDTPEGQVHYRYCAPASTAGPARTPVLLLHMSATSSVYFEKLIHIFVRAGHPCYAPDMPGFGGSFNPASDPPSLRWYADIYASFITTVISTDSSPIHILGHHSGAPLGVEFEVAYPHLTLSLTLIGPVVQTPEQRQAALKNFAPPAFNEPVADGSHLVKTWDYLHLPGRVPHENVDMMHREVIDHLRAWQGRLQAYKCVFNHDGYKMLPKVKCPVLGVCAKDDGLWATFGQAQEARPDMKVHEVKGGNYEPEVDAEGVAAAALPFFEKAEAK